MEIVALTVPALLLAGITFVLGPRRGVIVLFLVLPFGAAAAFNLPVAGNASIIVADLVALSLIASLAIRPALLSKSLALMVPGQPGFLLVLLYVIAVVVTIAAPRIGEGVTDVFAIGRVADQVGIVSTPLAPSGGNLTQLFRLALGVGTFFAVAAAFRTRPEGGMVVALGVATIVHLFLGALDVATFEAGIDALLEPIRTANYAIAVDHKMGGMVKRMIGGFPEASAFGYFSLALFGFWAQYATSGGASRWAVPATLALMVAIAWSASTSAYVASGAFLAFLALRAVSEKRITTGAAIWVGSLVTCVVLGLACLVLAITAIPEVYLFFDRLLFSKLESDSGIERGSWNAQAWRNFLDTWGVGAGVGSVRASNWLLATLASIGVAGTLVYFAFLWSVFRLLPMSRLRRDRETSAQLSALRSGCVALLLSALLTKATPDLELIFFALVGAMVGLAGHRRIEPSNATSSSRNASALRTA